MSRQSQVVIHYIKPEVFRSQKECGVTTMLNSTPNDTQDDCFSYAPKPYQRLVFQLKGAERGNLQNVSGFKMESLHREVQELVIAIGLHPKLASVIHRYRAVFLQIWQTWGNSSGARLSESETYLWPGQLTSHLSSLVSCLLNGLWWISHSGLSTENPAWHTGSTQYTLVTYFTSIVNRNICNFHRICIFRCRTKHICFIHHTCWLFKMRASHSLNQTR